MATLIAAPFYLADAAAVTARAGVNDRGAVSGLLHRWRNLGLLAGATLMGAVFTAAAVAVGDTVLTAPPDAIAAVMRLCFPFGAGFAVKVMMIAASAEHGR